MGIQIRLLQENELHLANTFFNTVYQSNRTQETFQWEFLDSPFGKAIYVGAIDDSFTAEIKIVGIQCAIPIELTDTEGNVVLTAKSEDTLVDPAYRGQKIFERMYEVLFEESKKAGIKYIWGFTPADKAFSRIGFSIPFKTQQALFVFNPVKAYQYLSKLNPQNKLKQKIQILGLSFLSWTKGFFNSATASSKYAIIDGDFNLLHPHFQSFYDNRKLYNLHCTPAFNSWRLIRNPYQNQYTDFLVTFKGEVIANVLCNVRGELSYIEEVLVKNDRFLVPVIKLALQKIKKRNPALVRVLCFNYNETLEVQRNAFDDVGFKTLDRGNFFVWKKLDDDRIDHQQLFLNRLFTQGNL
jgi:GNAT superfamily N-acetyltransferase